MESNLEMRRSEAAKIEVMIGEEMDEFQLWLKTLGVRPVIRALQDKSNAIHEETMESLFNKLPELDEHQRKVIRRLTKSIVNQMMHDPINVIKEMSGGKQGMKLLIISPKSLRYRNSSNLIQMAEIPPRLSSLVPQNALPVAAIFLCLRRCLLRQACWVGE